MTIGCESIVNVTQGIHLEWSRLPQRYLPAFYTACDTLNIDCVKWHYRCNPFNRVNLEEETQYAFVASRGRIRLTGTVRQLCAYMLDHPSDLANRAAVVMMGA